VAAVVAIAASLGISTVAEGVEARAGGALHDLGCREAGVLVRRPCRHVKSWP
jgi:EAL domain-containing protein (putative c-di-GMP-specific phosphodiesterase class I)